MNLLCRYGISTELLSSYYQLPLKHKMQHFGVLLILLPYTLASDGNWWDHANIYQIYPRSFQDSDGDGVGDLRGIKNRIDYLKDLNVDAIWLSPIFESPMKDFGYDISNFTKVDPLFGTKQDLKDLINDAHSRGEF